MENFAGFKAAYDFAFNELIEKIGNNEIPRDLPEAESKLWFNRLYVLNKLIESSFEKFDKFYQTDLPIDKLKEMYEL